MTDGKIIIFSAPSGAGKTSIVHALLKNNPEKLSFSVSATTRKLRGVEVSSKDYYYLSVKEFQQKIEEDAFVEYEQVYNGLYYGTLKSEIERIWKMGKSVILDVDVTGGLNLKAYFSERALSVFVKPPNIAALEERLRKRNTESEEQLQQRLQKAASELSFETQFDKVVENIHLDEAIEKAQHLLDDFLSA